MFGEDNCYMATSDKVEYPDSPLNFEEKKVIMDAYGVSDKLVKVKNPYKCEEITQTLDVNSTSLVFLVGEKDRDRVPVGPKLDGTAGYFEYYREGMELQPLTNRGYILIIPDIKVTVPNYGNMSSTVVRKALRECKEDEYDKTFRDLFGWYERSIAEMVKDRVVDQNPYSTITATLPQQKPMDMEVGTKHMAHPFEIPSVTTGLELLDIFKRTAQGLMNSKATVKIDGINVPIKLIGNEEFGIDRLSNKPLDIVGTKLPNLVDRFGKDHGMVDIGIKVLSIFNKALPSIQPELKKLGMWDNRNFLFNLEFVEGKSNVKSYGKNFIVINGLMEIVRVSDTRRQSKEIYYDQEALSSLVAKLNKVSTPVGFTIYSPIGAEMAKTPDFEYELKKEIIIPQTAVSYSIKTLQEWLNLIKIPKDETVKLLNGKVVGALSKELLIELSTKSVFDVISDKQDYGKAVAGYITNVATMRLGDALLHCMNSEIGKVGDQEGIVVRNQDIYNKPYKITGKFIVEGLKSPFNIKK